MPLLPHRIPAAIGTLDAASFAITGEQFDMAIGGIPFMEANTHDDPSIRKTTEFKRQQFDNAPEAGEQSLGQWWIRSQASWHSGAGQLYMEPAGGQDEFSRTRFHSSKNVDVWTVGKVTRLPDTTSIFATASAITAMVAGTKSGTDYVLTATGTTLTGWSSASGTTTVYSWTGTGTILALTTDGSNYFVADSVGVWKAPIDNGSIGVKVWNTGSALVALGWVKQRLMAGIANAVYELSGGGGPTLPTAKYSHPDTLWRWTAFCESPTAIMAAGYSGGYSAVIKFTLSTTDGSTPTLTGGATAVSMPSGEQIQCMTDYLGGFIAIGTNTGVWVGAFDNFAGNFTLGPKALETTAAVRGIVGRGRFLYVTGSRWNTDGESGLVRIDLGEPIDKAGHLAYAADLICPSLQTSDVAGVVVLPTLQRIAFGVSSIGVFKEGTTAGTVREAWVKMSRIRYTTVEPKLFKMARIRGTFTGATLKVYVETSELSEQTIVNTSAATVDPAEFRLNVAPAEWVSIRIEMDGAAGAELRSYMVKSLPAVRRSRTLRLILSCFDQEMDRNGVEVGYDGWAWQRLLSLELIENGSDETLIERFTPLGTEADTAVIDEIQFVQTSRSKPVGGKGGFLIVTARTIA